MDTRICDRCHKEVNKTTGTSEFMICEDCFNELQNGDTK